MQQKTETVSYELTLFYVEKFLFVQDLHIYPTTFINTLEPHYNAVWDPSHGTAM